MAEPNFFPDAKPFDKDGNMREAYVRITYDGTHCICKPSEVAAMVPADDASAYQVADVLFSRQELDAMPDFNGW